MANKEWKPNEEDKIKFAKKIEEIKIFCKENKILPTKNFDSYYFTVNNNDYVVSNKSKDYYKGKAIYINASKLRIKQIYSDLQAGLKLNSKGFSIDKTEKSVESQSKIVIEPKKIEEARNKNILEIAENLGMKLKRVGTQTYQWNEHDSFVINQKNNTWYWYSKDSGGDTIGLVQTIKEVNFKEATNFLLTGQFEKFEDKPIEKEPFHYYLEKLEQKNFDQATNYLMNERKLSLETIKDFLAAEGLAEAKHYFGDAIEPVIVFKTKDREGKITGASLQGIEKNFELHDRGYLKRIMKNSDGLDGFTFDIGKPERLVFCEAPIDLMSYYELHKENLSNVRLVAMDGLKEATISRKFVELIEEIKGENSNQTIYEKGQQLSKLAKLTSYFKDPKHNEIITIAVDNDKAGRNFIDKLRAKGISFKIDLPPLNNDQNKMDWNDYLKEEKGEIFQAKKSDVQISLDGFASNHEISLKQNQLQERSLK